MTDRGLHESFGASLEESDRRRAQRMLVGTESEPSRRIREAGEKFAAAALSCRDAFVELGRVLAKKSAKMRGPR